MKKDTFTASIFPARHTDLSEWRADPLASYSSWASSNPAAESTRKVKTFMWGKWCKYMTDKFLVIDEIEAKHLQDFFERAEIAKAQRQRYLRLIECVYIYLNSLGLSLRNPGTDAGIKSLGKGSNDPTAFLSETEQAEVERVIDTRFTHGLSARIDASLESKEKKKKRKKKREWMGVRDAAICAVMLGGGASVFATERLTVSCTNSSDDRLSLPRKKGGVYEALLLPIGQRAITVWLNRRRTIPHDFGDTFFPADAGSRRRPETLSTTASMSPSSIFRAVQNVLADAGITGERACGQTLRNTYAASLIRLGLSDEELTQYLGFTDITSAIRIHAAWSSFKIENP